jgi:hypothetical protein
MIVEATTPPRADIALRDEDRAFLDYLIAKAIESSVARRNARSGKDGPK